MTPEMIVHIINRQNICKPNTKKTKAALKFFLHKAAPKSSWKELSLVLTDDDGIRQVKRQFFDVDCVTDVISFALQPQPADGDRRMAEIVVNVERVCMEGKKRRGFDHEFALYLAHGCDHLAGHDDRTIKERKEMRRRELRWLREAAELDLLSRLFVPARKPT